MRIFDFALPTFTTIVLDRSPDDTAPPELHDVLALLTSCKQLHSKVAYHVYGKNSFAISGCAWSDYPLFGSPYDDVLDEPSPVLAPGWRVLNRKIGKAYWSIVRNVILKY